MRRSYIALVLAGASSKRFTYYYPSQTCYIGHLLNSSGSASAHTLQGATGNLGTIATSAYSQVLIYGWVNRLWILMSRIKPWPPPQSGISHAWRNPSPWILIGYVWQYKLYGKPCASHYDVTWRGGANQRVIMHIDEQRLSSAHHPNRDSVMREEILSLEY